MVLQICFSFDGYGNIYHGTMHLVVSLLYVVSLAYLKGYSNTKSPSTNNACSIMPVVELPRINIVGTLLTSGEETMNLSLQQYWKTLPETLDAYNSLGSASGATYKWIEVLQTFYPDKKTVFFEDESSGPCTVAAETDADVALYTTLERTHARRPGGDSVILLDSNRQHCSLTVALLYKLCSEYATVSLSSLSLWKCADVYVLCKDYLSPHPPVPANVEIPLWFWTRLSEAFIILGQVRFEHVRDEGKENVAAWKASFGAFKGHPV